MTGCFWRCVLLGVVLSGNVSAQDRAMKEGASFHLVEQNDESENRIPWPDEVALPSENAGWRHQLMSWYHDRARYNAHIDSVSVSARTVWVEPGPVVPIATVDVTGGGAWSPDGMMAHAGEPASAVYIESIVGSLLEEASALGYLAARASVERADLKSDGIHLAIHLETGPKTSLDGIRLDGDKRTRSATIFSTLGLRPGQPLAGLDLDNVRSMLASAGLHDEVSAARFELVSDSAALLVIPVVPVPPGQFDLVAGALPGADGDGTRFIGSGHLLLHNAFGQGRRMEARVSRLPAQASSALLRVETPAPGGWPLHVSVSLEGHQQDSTWNQTRLGSRVMYRFDPTTWIGASLSADRTRAGFSGTEFVGDSQLVPRSSARLAGMTMRISRLDHARLPQKGVRLETTFERGIRTSRSLEIVELDTLSVRRSERRERLSMDLDMYVMSGQRLGWAAGVDVSAIRAGRPDVSELMFLGGANSLRGYDENRFRGTAVGRAFVEGRWYVDRSSWGFLFLDAGWVAVDADFETGLPAILGESEGFHPGYGLGFVFSSAVGPLSLSYALNPEVTFSEGRVHVGLSFGL